MGYVNRSVHMKHSQWVKPIGEDLAGATELLDAIKDGAITATGKPVTFDSGDGEWQSGKRERIGREKVEGAVPEAFLEHGDIVFPSKTDGHVVPAYIAVEVDRAEFEVFWPPVKRVESAHPNRSPFLSLLLTAESNFGASVNEEKKGVIVHWLKSNAKTFGVELSDRMAGTMGTILRQPERQRGGALPQRKGAPRNKLTQSD